MSDTHAALMDLVGRATAGLTETARGLSALDISSPSGLPGWTRGHVLTHLANNADGLTRLILGTNAGQALPMYASVEGRNADIAAGATRPADVIIAHVELANRTLDATISTVTDWQASTVFSTVTGAVERPLIEVLRMRLREVAIHHVDLATDHHFIDEDPRVTRSLVVGAAGRLSAESASVIDLLIDGEPVATISPQAPTQSPCVVDLDGGAMLGWLTGRAEANPDLPVLPAWG